MSPVSPSPAGATSARTVDPWVVLVSTALAVFAVFLDTTILFVAFPAIAADFADVSTSTLSWVLNAYTITFAAMLIPAGRLADRVGRRRVFLWAATGFTLASMLCGLAPGAGWLVAFRVLQAIAAAGLVPSSLALVLQTFPRPKIPVAVAIWGAIAAVAGAAGPTLGALVVDHLGWRWAFFINLPVGVVSVLLGRAVLPEGREADPGRLPDPVGVVVLAAGLALAAYGIVQTEVWGWSSAGVWVALAVAAVLVVGFVDRCRRVDNPLVDLSLFASRSFRWANTATLVFFVGFTAMFLGSVLFLTQVWGYTIVGAGMAVAVGPSIVAVTAPFLGRLAARVGQRRLLIPGGLVWAAGALLLSLRVGERADYWASYFPSIVLTGVGVALCLPQLASASVQGLPSDRFASGSAVNQTVRNLGSTFGVALLVAFVAGGEGLEGFRRGWWLIVLCGVTVSLVSTRLPHPVAGRVGGAPPGAIPAG